MISIFVLLLYIGCELTSPIKCHLLNPAHLVVGLYFLLLEKCGYKFLKPNIPPYVEVLKFFLMSSCLTFFTRLIRVL